MRDRQDDSGWEKLGEEVAAAGRRQQGLEQPEGQPGSANLQRRVLKEGIDQVSGTSIAGKPGEQDQRMGNADGDRDRQGRG